MEWINFKKKLPTKNKYVLFYVPKGPDKDSYIFYAYYTDGKEGDSYWGSVWFDSEDSKYMYHDPTHWMPLPSEPK